ncbi:glycoside hydrolase family 37 [Vibrio sp. S9_S30]|uniref:amylo-alpha-1,6-glucosidase n=1 Tax=Vibrio sp. S9_S30 TaxID=2720226 RepID=UPI0016807163|nr:trehalase family glycosidase [Vibrio sp. S9_S30]MBD1557516.1 glycoside hydrolase family 37 [Vibrio sp. S9_S30]
MLTLLSDTILDASKLPFSKRNRFLTISWLKDDPKHDKKSLYIRSVKGGDLNERLGRLFQIIPVDNHCNTVAFTTELTASCLTLKSKEGWIKLAIGDEETLYFEGFNLGLRLERKTGDFDLAQALPNGDWHIGCFEEDLKAQISTTQGSLAVSAPWQDERAERISMRWRCDSENRMAGNMVLFQTIAPKFTKVTIDQAIESSKADFEHWLSQSIAVRPCDSATAIEANYILWANGVPVKGQLTRPSIYMSKNWMINIWSWDNCFVALSLAKTQPQLAYDQVMVIFDHQDECGLIPDFINDQYAFFNFTKPPIHGWALSQMIDAAPEFYTVDRLAEIYHVLSRWTDYWFLVAENILSPLPVYFHGNDSGWDNATVFNQGGPLLSPDLATFLILQMDVLSNIAKRLGKVTSARKWSDKADALQEKLIEQLWTGDHFVARKLDSGRAVTDGDSLILNLPLLLGERLPVHIRNKLIDNVSEPNRFLTNHGLATESLKSPLYNDDGYWRGPIWAPTTFLMVSALDSVQQFSLANEIADKYVKMAAHSGMAENYNAKTGDGLRDRAFAWSSAVYLLLAARLK